jgi:hypothetical protein
VGEDEKWREKDESLVFAVLTAVLEIELTRRAIGLMRMRGNGRRYMCRSQGKKSSVWLPSDVLFDELMMHLDT